MEITHALIIDQPWISKILSGEKDWEMRSRHCRQRGYIGLIAKGTGTVVGIAKVTDSLGPLSSTEMIANTHRHRIPESDISSGKVDKWNHAWQLVSIRKFDTPVPYQHKNGAVTWVKLDEKAQALITSQITKIQEETTSKTPMTETVEMEIEVKPFSNKAAARNSLSERSVTISDGNIKNNHIYLRSILDFFPEESIGGSNKREMASHLLTITFDKSATVETDIAGDKKIFRKRTGISEFFKINQIKAGDEVIIKKMDRYHFLVERA